MGVGLDETNTVNCPSGCFSMMKAGHQRFFDLYEGRLE
jgi:hypothetical protein